MRKNNQRIDFSDQQSLRHWEQRFEQWLTSRTLRQGESEGGLNRTQDQAHGLPHIRRVVKTALGLAAETDANLTVVVAAAWLHDCVIVAKNSPQRSQASRLSAQRAVDFLKRSGFPDPWLAGVEHAIEAHSFSAAIAPKTIEAKIVQDADRLDALGAIGIARCVQTGVALNSPLYDAADPLVELREADDRISVVDHFYTKLLNLSETMQTVAGRVEAERRTRFMRGFLEQLRSEI